VLVRRHRLIVLAAFAAALALAGCGADVSTSQSWFAKPFDISGRSAGYSFSELSETKKGQRAITPETALRLARYFGGSAALWLRLQVAYDLSCAETELADKIAAEVTPAAA